MSNYTPEPPPPSREGDTGITDNPFSQFGPGDSGSSDEPTIVPRAERPKVNGLAITSLVLGCVMILLMVLTGLPAIIFGIIALVQINRSEGRQTGKGMAIAGLVLGCASIPLTFLIVLPVVARVREAAERLESQDNLKGIGIGLHNYEYEAVWRRFPPACFKRGLGRTEMTKPNEGLSWRVEILPLIDQEDLYKQFKLDEPWDSAHNIKLLSQMPKIYRRPGDPEDTTETPYRVFYGRGAIFNPMRQATLADIWDGTSNTILVVEARETVPWTKPAPLPFSDHDPIPPLGKAGTGGFFDGGSEYASILFADGSVQSIRKDIAMKRLRPAITRRGGEVINLFED